MEEQVSSLVLDIRRTLRGLGRRPLYLLVTSGSLAIGMGSVTGVYAWLDNLVLRPLPLVPGIDRLVALNAAQSDGSTSGAPRISYPAFEEWQQGAGRIGDMAVAAPVRLAARVDGLDLTTPAWGLLVSEHYFTVLGVHPARGRVLDAADHRGSRPVAVLSDHYWRRQLGAREDILGRQLWLNGLDVTVVGVMPSGFFGHDVGYAFDLWVPLSQQPMVLRNGNLLSDARAQWLSGIARLSPGISLAAANATLDRVARAASTARGERPPTSAAFIPLREWRAGSLFGPLLSTLFIVALLVLALAGANVAGLTLMRRAEAAREAGVLAAIGAGRKDLVRLCVLEGAVLTVLGSAGGLVTARAIGAALPRLIPPVPLPVEFALELNWRIGAALLGASLLTLGFTSVLPALRASRIDPLAAIRGPAGGPARQRGLRALVGVQVAIACLSLVAAGFFLASLFRARAVDPGFSRPQEVLLLGLDLNAAGVDRASGPQRLDEILAAVRTLPGVAGAAVATMVPLGAGGHRYAPTTVAEYTPGPTEDTQHEHSEVSPGYFETMGIRIVRGRGFESRDRAGGEPVIVVNEAFAHRFWPGVDALGHRVDQGNGFATVIGVARDGRYDNLSDRPRPIVFWPVTQWYRPAVTLHIRSAGTAPRSLLEPVRRAVAAVAPDLRLDDARTLAEHGEVSTFVPRVGSAALGLFGVLALGLASSGVYAVVAFTARRERKATAIRLAIGATSGRVIRRSLAAALRLTLLGAAAGLAGGYWLVIRLADRLQGTSPGEPLPYLGALTLVVLATSAAGFWPGRRASRQSVMAVIREEGQ